MHTVQVRPTCVFVSLQTKMAGRARGRGKSRFNAIIPSTKPKHNRGRVKPSIVPELPTPIQQTEAVRQLQQAGGWRTF